MCAKTFLWIRFAFSFVERINTCEFCPVCHFALEMLRSGEELVTSMDLFCSDDGNALEEAIKRRGLQRSVMQYSTFDWSSIPLSQERRLAPDSIPDQPRILTVRFR